MIIQSRSSFDLLCEPINTIEDSDLTESAHQNKIIKHLIASDWEPIKIVTATKAGNSDIVACSPSGQFWMIEVKKLKGKYSKLQKAKLKIFWKKKAICIVAYGFLDFKYKFNALNKLFS